MSTQNILLASAILVAFICSWTTVHVVGLSPNKKDDSTNNQSTATDINFPNKHDGKYLNYVRLLDGQCFNCSTYKCTTHKANMGGSEWCIMLFPDALAHCDSDANCGGYTMTTARWFHEQYDKNGQVAVHLTKVGEKPFNCSFTEWSSYEKQSTTRNTPVVYGKTTCPTANNYNYVFDSTSNGNIDDQVYSCQNHPQNQDDTNVNCILLMSEAIKYCDSDDQCQGFAINTNSDWQKKYSKNGMQAVQLFGQGATPASNEIWRSFKKQA